MLNESGIADTFCVFANWLPPGLKTVLFTSILTVRKKSRIKIPNELLTNVVNKVFGPDIYLHVRQYFICTSNGGSDATKRTSVNPRLSIRCTHMR